MAVTEIGTRAARALDDLYRSHSAEIYRYAYAMLGNRSDAEDVVQTTFMNALRALERGERPRNASSWLVAIAHNVIRQRFRQAQARPAEVELDTEVPVAPASDDETPSLDDVLQALAKIPESQREALILREFEGRPYAEIAGILGVSTSALETLLFRARRSLAEELDNRVTCEFAEQAVLRRTDHRLSRKEKRRLGEHIRTCPDCARFEVLQRRQSRALKGLALLPIPASLTLFKGMTDTAAAASLPTIGAATATTAVTASAGTGAGGVLGGLLGGGVAVKAATVAATVAVAGGVAGTTAVTTRDRAPAQPVPAQQAPGPATAAAAKAAAAERAAANEKRVAAAELAAARKAAAAEKSGTAGKSATAGSNQPQQSSSGGKSAEKAVVSTGKPTTTGKPETTGKPTDTAKPDATGTAKAAEKRAGTAGTAPAPKKPAKTTAAPEESPSGDAGRSNRPE